MAFTSVMMGSTEAETRRRCYEKMTAQWPKLTYEEASWERDPSERDLIPKSRRRRITATYHAAIPLTIASRELRLPMSLEARISEVVASLARFDERQARTSFNLPALLLRSESAASSQIEHLTSSIRNIALAELSPRAPRNAQLIAGNVAAMRTALALPDDLTENAIIAVHETLIAPTDDASEGGIRQEQVWIGGTPYSPHEALFVPPLVDRIRPALDDLLLFAERTDLDPLAKAAIFHAQFETIHPFVDGNGRTGRALLAKMLEREGLLRHTTLPTSAGLLHDVDVYMDALDCYHEGDPLPIVEQVVEALELAVVIGTKTTALIEEVIDGWHAAITQRKGSRIYELPELLVQQPVVDSRYIAEHLKVSQRAARDILELGCAYGMLKPIGNAQRSIYYQSSDLIEIMDEISALAGIRRLLRS